MWYTPLKIKYSFRNLGNVSNMIQNPKVKLIGYARADMGVGQGIRLNALALNSVGASVSVHSLSDSPFADSNHSIDFLINDDIDHDIVVLQINADNTVNYEERIPKKFTENKYKIGFWFWELSRFPKEWDIAISKVDEIWVSSQFVKDSIQKNTSKPIHVFPLPIHNPNLNIIEKNRSLFNLKEDIFYFLMTMDLHSYIERKNPFSVIESFKKAFDKNEKVGLVIKLHGNQEFSTQRKVLFDAIVDDPRIVVIDKNLTRIESDTLQLSIDCYVSLHRSEGFGLNIAECMSYGKPVIATGYSGNLEFMSSKNSLLVDYELIPLQKNEYPYWENQVWAAPNINQAAMFMWRMYEDKDFREKIGNTARLDIQERLNLQVVGKMMLNRLNQISENFL